ncbi:MAG: hypothetical protein Q4G33_09775 [bacterium]|nr:hypothetical protein [bacterium]
MSYNYENTQIILEGADLLYSMLMELNEGIRHLPGCKVTANLKRLSVNIGAASGGIYQTMKKIAAETEEMCDECADDTDEYGEADIPSGTDLKEFLEKIAEILVSDKPVSISADIYINEGKSENANSNGNVESEE